MFVELVFAFLLFIVFPVVLIVWAVRRLGNRTGPRGTDARSVRRFFQYLLLYALMIVAAVGLSDLLALLFKEPVLAGDNSTELARALTFSVFGIPIFVLLAAWSRRQLQQDPDEARSLGWAFYASAAPLTALAVDMVALHNVVSSVLAGQRFDWPALAQLIVWFVVWFVHWTIASQMLDADRRQGQLVLGSLIGLVTTVVGLVGLLGASLDVLLVREASVLLVGQEQHQLAQAATTVVVGVPVWVVYWLMSLSRARRTQLWFGYVLLVGVGGSLVLALVGASIALYQVLVWLVGETDSAQAARHFESSPTAVAFVVVGAISWWYHRQVMAGATSVRTEVTRVYEYLMAGIALLAAAVGVTMVVVALVESLVPVAAVEVGTSVVNSLLSAVTLLLVGGPLWWFFWSRIGRAARADGLEELGSPTRRTYLFLLFGLGGVSAVIAVLVAAFVGIQGALQGFDAQVVREMRIPVAILLATGAVSGYHWAVYRDDRSRLPETAPRRGPRYVLLVGAPDGAVGDAVERLTGARVDLWVRADGLAGPWAVDDVVAAVNQSGADAVAVVAGPTGLETTGMQRP